MGKARKTALLKAFARQKTPFQQVEITEQMIHDYPLLMHCSAIFSNSRVEVHTFNLETAIGGVVQCTLIRHGDIAPLSWEEIQESIHEIFGPEVVAVEVYPSLESEWSTKLGLRVLWILPSTWQLPFGLHLPGAWGKPVK